MRYHHLFFLSLFILVFAACSSTNKSSQVSTSGASQAAAPSSGTPSSRSTGTESEASSALGSGRTSTKKANAKMYQRTHADAVKEAEQRQEANAKRREKEAKLAEKPQYADPSYFGHKKKPKKRAPGKRKFCKECGITH
jgi:hypothetical protein